MEVDLKIIKEKFLGERKTCRCGSDNFIFVKDHEHGDLGSEKDDVLLCLNCDTIYGDNFFEFPVRIDEDIYKNVKNWKLN